MKGNVYLLCDSSKENTYKIGATRGKIGNRIKNLQTGNSGDISIVHIYETEHPFFIENILHKRFKHKLIKNEWFGLDSEDINNFINNCIEIENIIYAMKDNYFFKKIIKK